MFQRTYKGRPGRQPHGSPGRPPSDYDLEVVPPPHGGFEEFVHRLSGERQNEDLASAVLDEVGRHCRADGEIGETVRRIGPDTALHCLVVYRYGLKLDGVDFAVVAIVAEGRARTRYLLDGWLCEDETDRRKVLVGADDLVRRWLAWRSGEAE